MSKNYETFKDEDLVNNGTAIEKENDSLLIDKLMEDAGYTFYQWKVITITTLLLFADGIHMNITNTMFIPFKNLYQVSDEKFSLISSILFVGVALGSLISGQISQLCGRKNAIIYANLFMFILSMGMSFSYNYVIFTICRFLIGACLGTIIPMIFGILTEYLPVFSRSLVLNSVWTGFSFGVIYTLLIMLIYTPNYEVSGIRAVMIYNSAPFLILIFILYFFLDESPRCLIVDNKEEQGLKILELISKMQLTNDQKDQICKEVKGGINKEMKVSITYLFHETFFKTTVILIFIWFINSYICYGGNFVLQETVSKISKTSQINSKTRDLIISQIVIYLIGVPGNFISGWVSEIKFFGRLNSSAFFYVLSAILQLFACLFTKHFDLLFGFANLCSSSAFNITSAYTSEIYPTVIRDLALGFFYFCTRVSGFSSQFIAIFLEKKMFLLQYYVMIMTCVIGTILILMVPNDSYGIAIDLAPKNDKLDKKISDEDHQNKIKVK